MILILLPGRVELSYFLFYFRLPFRIVAEAVEQSEVTNGFSSVWLYGRFYVRVLACVPTHLLSCFFATRFVTFLPRSYTNTFLFPSVS